MLDGRLQFVHAAMRTAPDLFFGKGRKPALYQIDPRGTGGSEVHVEARTFRQPVTNNGGLMSAVVVHDEMHVETRGNGLVDGVQKLAELCAAMPKYPQVLLNVRVARRFDPMSAPSVLNMVSAVERKFDGRGRIVLRASGTEPVIRVMVEGYDASLVKAGARDIAAEVEAVAARAALLGASDIATLAQS